MNLLSDTYLIYLMILFSAILVLSMLWRYIEQNHQK